MVSHLHARFWLAVLKLVLRGASVKSGQLWQDFRHMSMFLLIVPSLSTLGGNFLQRETHLQVILQGHDKMGVSCGT